MKVFVLGGYGAVGLTCAELLVEIELVSEIALAGRSVERAKQAAAKIGDKARAVQVDGADEKHLASLVAGYDIIVNTASNKVALPALRAAIRAGAHYCDVGFGRDFIAQMLEPAAEARDAGITAIICNGNAPSITNLMGVHAADQLGETEQLQGGMSLVVEFGGSGRVLSPQQWLENPKESLAVLQEFRPFLGWILKVTQQNKSRTVRVYHDSGWADQDPLTSGLQVPLSQGGTVTAYPYGSYDPIGGSLPDDLSRARPVQVWFSPFPPQLHDLFRKHALRVTAAYVDPVTAVNSFYETVETDPDRWLTVTEEFIAYPFQWVTAVGRKEKRAARYSCWMAPAMWIERNARLGNSAPLTAAVLRILRGEVREWGIMTAETAFKPLPFLNEVASLMPGPFPDGKLINGSFEWLE
jgi:hypothetical protein